VAVSSTDPAGSRDFYRGLVGWTYQMDSPAGRGQEMTAWCGGRPVAGLATVPTWAGQGSWTLYLATTDVVHSAQLLRAWGGRVLTGPARVSGRGTTVIGVDPVGAVIGLCQPARPWRLGRIGPGSLYWAQLDTWDAPGADAFYAALFGYQQHQIGDGREVDYTIWSRDGHPLLGRLRMHPAWADPEWTTQWMLHFAVDPRIGTDAAADRVVALGGLVDIDPYDSDFGRTALVSDPCGAAFALIDPTDRVDPTDDLAAGSARVDDPYDD
jgi:predicted enzyme related to lactoylglutathione lyase